jgi:lipopolysaccharide biosynthesis protein
MFDKLCLFAHFDRDDVVADYVIRYLKAIRAAGFPTVVISTSKLSLSDVERLKTVADDVILRENSGHDFASWGLGLERYADKVSGQLLIANDSVYAPVGDLGDAVRRLTSVKADAYGMIESLEIARHLQSWFLVLEKPVHSHPDFRAVFTQDFSKMAKTDIIRHGEIGLSQTLLSHGFRLHALFSGLSRTGTRMRMSSNYSHFLWRELIETEELPFLKIELLRVNPCGIADLYQWREVVERRAPELAPMIEDHLKRTVAGHGGDIQTLHHIPVPRDDIQSFIRRDYAYASARRPIANFGNMMWLNGVRVKRLMLHTAYRILLPVRHQLRGLRRKIQS